MKPRHKTTHPAPQPADLDATPVAGASAAIALVRQKNYGDITDQKANRVARAIRDRVADAQEGDLDFALEMLATQAIALNSMFTQLMGDAALEKPLKVKSELWRLALQAQNQSQKTLRAIADIHRPRAVQFVRELNQQNNLHLEGMPDGMDGGKALTPGRDLPTFPDLGTIDGSQDPGRQGDRQQEQFERRLAYPANEGDQVIPYQPGAGTPGPDGKIEFS